MRPLRFRPAVYMPAVLLLCLLQVTAVCAAVDVETRSLRLQFSDHGDLLHARACFPDCRTGSANIKVLSGSQGLLKLDGHDDVLKLEQDVQNQQTILSWSDARGGLVHRWRIPDQGWLLSFESADTRTLSLVSGEDFRPAPSSGFGYLLEQTRYLVFDGDDVQTIGLDEAGQVNLSSNGWLGFRNRFWTVMLNPQSELDIKPVTGEAVQDARLDLSHTGPALAFDIYLGPIEPAALSGAAGELESLMYSGLWFWLRWICQALYFLLNGIYVLIPQWGLAVMALSVVVGILMRPLSKIADRLQDQVHLTDARLGPGLASIKKSYKGAEQSEKILALYKAEKVHPLYSLKSLAGVFVVIPVFIGAFDMLAENIHLSGESFLWIADLSHPDAFMQLPFRLPFFGEYLNLLPFIMTGFSFVASKLHAHPAMDAAQRRKHSRNLVMMAVGFLVLFYTFPAGMVLYWTTNNLISVIKTLWKKRKVVVA